MHFLHCACICQRACCYLAPIRHYCLDLAFIGAASVAEDGKVCGPVVGDAGVYVYKVTGRDTGAFYTEEDAKLRDAQMSQYTTQMVVPVMMDDAQVVDNRARFF